MEIKNNPDITSFDEILDAKYGAPGTPSREQFRREAYAYCVGVMIHDARKEEGITQQELADRVGTNKSYISRIERGHVEPSASFFLNIINALGLSIMRPAL